ncbi:MAG: 6-bladed beta-propeller [Muribaculaceae bacterium]|nr:6-bladed beta-propeller [Muribaculaceae bacterium]
MKQLITFTALAAAAMLLPSCGQKGGGQSSQEGRTISEILADSPVAAQRVLVGEDTMVVARLTEAPEPVTLLASEMFDEFELIKLEDTEGALTGGGTTWVSQNHILVYDGNNVKLYDRKGKFIANVGARGQGPGEYSIAPYFLTIDEMQGKIYMMTYSASQINTYNVADGTFAGSIPLVYESPKGFCKIDPENGRITVASMQFKDVAPCSPVWVQDFDGNLISEVKRPDLGITPDFSNEINPGMSSDGKELYHSQCLITELIADTLYRSDGKTIHPEFTYDFGEKVPMHSLRSFPQFYVMKIFGDPVMVSENSYMVGSNMPFVIDRTSLKGAPAELMIDQLGTLTFKKDWDFMSTPGYFTMSCDPGDLLDMLKAAPDTHPSANEDGLKRMEELRNSIDHDGNHYVLIGHWKQ